MTEQPGKLGQWVLRKAAGLVVFIASLACGFVAAVGLMLMLVSLIRPFKASLPEGLFVITPAAATFGFAIYVIAIAETWLRKQLWLGPMSDNNDRNVRRIAVGNGRILMLHFVFVMVISAVMYATGLDEWGFSRLGDVGFYWLFGLGLTIVSGLFAFGANGLITGEASPGSGGNDQP